MKAALEGAEQRHRLRTFKSVCEILRGNAARHAGRENGGEKIDGQQVEAAAEGTHVVAGEGLGAGGEATEGQPVRAAAEGKRASVVSGDVNTLLQKIQSRVCPILRSHRGRKWSPSHGSDVDDGVLVARSGKGRNYHYYQQRRRGALQWGHCAVSVRTAVENECVECLQCRRQRQAWSWGQGTGFPVDAWQQQAPAGVDPESGDAAWVADTNDVRLLHWMCVSRGLGAGGSNTEMVSGLKSVSGQWRCCVSE